MLHGMNKDNLKSGEQVVHLHVVSQQVPKGSLKSFLHDMRAGAGRALGGMIAKALVFGCGILFCYTVSKWSSVSTSRLGNAVSGVFNQEGKTTDMKPTGGSGPDVAIAGSSGPDVYLGSGGPDIRVGGVKLDGGAGGGTPIQGNETTRATRIAKENNLDSFGGSNDVTPDSKDIVARIGVARPSFGGSKTNPGGGLSSEEVAGSTTSVGHATNPFPFPGGRTIAPSGGVSTPAGAGCVSSP